VARDWPCLGLPGIGLIAMALIAGYTICFISNGRPTLITIASADESAIERLTVARFGDVRVLARTPLDANALQLLKLKPGEWLEWVPAVRND
jgi:hypothetical protein